jgi:hypothetical protein
MDAKKKPPHNAEAFDFKFETFELCLLHLGEDDDQGVERE